MSNYNWEDHPIEAGKSLISDKANDFLMRLKDEVDKLTVAFPEYSENLETEESNLGRTYSVFISGSELRTVQQTGVDTYTVKNFTLT